MKKTRDIKRKGRSPGLKFDLKMKLTAVFILATFFGMYANDGYSQKKVTLRVTDATVAKVIDEIEATTTYKFVYNTRFVDLQRRVSLNVKKERIETVLEKLFDNTGTEYEVKEDQVILTFKKEEEKSQSKVQPRNQAAIERQEQYQLSGTVTNIMGNPLSGVNIIVKGAGRGAISDFEGNYIVNVQDKDTLIFSFIGYKTEEKPVRGRSIINIRLQEDVTALQEVEVNAGYWTVKERERTGNISRFTAEEIERQPVTNVLQAIKGQMPGVEVTQRSNIPGGRFTIQIRGQNSLRDNGNNPLYLIDGVPFPSTSIDIDAQLVGAIPDANPLNAINPSDIESIEILKDADATAIYGSRGANGVVLITTKKGKAGKAKLEIDISSGISSASNKMKLLSTDQYIEMREEAFANDGRTPSEASAPDLLLWNRNRYTDWQDILLGGSAYTTNAQASLSGGNSNVQFLFSGNYYKETTIFPGDFSFQRGSGHLNLNYFNDNQKLNLNISTTYTISENNLPNQNFAIDAIHLPPNGPEIYNENGDLNWENGTWDNPFAAIGQTYTAKTNSFISNIMLSYRIFPSLIVRSSIGYSSLLHNSITKIPIRFQDPFSVNSNENTTMFSNNSERSVNIEPQLEYRQNLLGGELTALIGATIQETINEGQSVVASGFSTEALMEDLGATETLQGRSIYSQYRYNAIFARVNYNWKEKYLLNLTGRRDGSSRFGPGKQFGNFGAVGGAWIFSNEEFIKKGLSFLNFGKLRASYGITGSDQIGDYGYLDSYTSTFVPYQIAALHPARMANPNYGWEINKKIEIALETGLLQDRIRFATSWYRNRSSNQLVGFPLPDITGFTDIQANLPATVQNTGIELELYTVNIQSEKFSWRTNMNITIPKNKLVEYPNLELSPFANQYIVGEPLNVARGYTFLGVDPDIGENMFLDTDENSIINNEDRMILQRSQRYFGGIGNSLTYKSLQLDFFFQFVKQTGRDYRQDFNMPGTLQNQPVEVMNRWQQPGDNSGIQKFSRGIGTAYNRWLASNNNFNTNRSYVRLQNISLSWDLPAKEINYIGLQSVRFYLRGQNLLTFTKFKGLDPEGLTQPLLRTTTMGLQITF
ncbi:SusC/RagA family TonB-linked outer membrane protein [Sinomicrobium kalidii]|uniref:SusC/RagA family TonB-linked outer membrane protein n=1 Tax=Sinomicrobium kalidii TaxID=2900738 RepID=UPI001E5387B3|nr:SusC/RagA family TonB-linked outer membrane protein [Sinomicrobium kalidii]UGU15314.1 SusC/RagA family TonB-linked outer membrane protein [Sinomicrobium kalidii]